MLPRKLEITSVFGDEPVESARRRWRALVEADLKGAPFERRLVTHTYEGIHVQPLYTAAETPAVPDPSGFSGLPPMTRGARAMGTSQRGWDLRQEHAEPEPTAANAAIREDLDEGVTSVVIRLDACARAGLDPSDPHGTQLAARDGVAAYTLDDLDRVLEGVHLSMIGVGLEAGAAFIPGAAMLAALWERRAVPAIDARGCFQADPLAVLARDGALPYTLGRALSDMADLAQWTSHRYPYVTAVRVGTAPYHHAGATATQDLAFSMATALEYLRAMTNAGLTIDIASRQLLFSYAVGCNFFLAIAKLRAARRLWARVVEACGGPEDARRMTMHVRPSKRVLTTREPWLNMLRNSACVFAAGFGGADAVSSTPYDAAMGEPSPRARRLARNTHHLLMEECHLHEVCDATGGSWYIETLTDELSEKAWVILQAIEARGGMSRALCEGWIARQIDDAAQPRLQNLATRRDVIVGVSDFPPPPEREPARTPIDRATIVAEACERLRRRNGTFPDGASPRDPDTGARTSWAVQRAKHGASIGEIASRLHADNSGPTTLDAAIHVHPYAEPFERLRDAADHYAVQCGSSPSVFLVVIGPLSRCTARANFCRSLFETGGFEVLGGEGGATAESAAAAFAASGSHIAVVCGPDESYPDAVPIVAPALHRTGARRVVLAGNPGANEAAFRAAGVDHFAFIKCDVVALLGSLLKEEGAAL